MKTPWNRILDLTWGQYQFVEAEESQKEEPLTDERLSSQALFDDVMEADWRREK